MKKIKVSNLGKSINKTEIFYDVNLEFEEGKIYGFIGKNGSGKTMFFKAICGLIKPSVGNIYIDDEPVNMFNNRPVSIGLVIENIGLYPEMTGLQNLKYLANINGKIGTEQIRRYISMVGLNPDDKRKVRKYSLGMKQKIVLAQAFMEEPAMLILDEPMNGLDVKSVENIRAIIRTNAENGAIILIASHNNDDIEELCDEVFDVMEGRIIRREIG